MTVKHVPCTDSDWLFESKFNGYRMLADFGAGAAELRTRNVANCTTWLLKVVHALAGYTGGPFVVDGEVLCVLSNLDCRIN